MTWDQAMEHALRRSVETGRKWYVRGYRRTISNPVGWLYGAYSVPNPPIAEANRR